VKFTNATNSVLWLENQISFSSLGWCKTIGMLLHLFRILYMHKLATDSTSVITANIPLFIGIRALNQIISCSIPSIWLSLIPSALYQMFVNLRQLFRRLHLVACAAYTWALVVSVVHFLEVLGRSEVIKDVVDVVRVWVQSWWCSTKCQWCLIVHLMRSFYAHIPWDVRSDQV